MVSPANGGGGNQQQTGGKKSNNKGTSTAKRKAIDETARRSGCPVLLESGCRVGELIDPNNPCDAVKMICQNPKCEFSPFIHHRCYEEWEDLLVTVMATTSWSRSWTDAQRRSNLWDKKGYQLIGKMCRCLCGKGHVRRDLDYKPPLNEETTKKKVKKMPANKTLPALKKVGCANKSSANPNLTNGSPGATATTTASSNTCFVDSAAKRGSDEEHAWYQTCSGQDVSCPQSPCPSTSTHEKGSETGTHRRLFNGQRCGSVPNLHSSTDDCDEDDEMPESFDEFENIVIPGVRSLLRWKNTPVYFNDPALSEILNGCSMLTRKQISDAGGLGVALAQTGYFIVGSDTVRLKENGNVVEAEYAPRNNARRRDQTPNSELAPRNRRCQVDCSASVVVNGTALTGNSADGNCVVALESAPNEERSTRSGLSRESNETFVVENGQCPAASIPIRSAPSFDQVGSAPSGGFVDARSPSSGFDEESTGSVKSEQDAHTDGVEAVDTPQLVPQRSLCRDMVNFGMWPVDHCAAYFNRSFPLYGTAAQLITPVAPFSASFVRPVLEKAPIAPALPPGWCYRKYRLFDGPNLEELFRRALPSIYVGAGRRFEPTNVS